MTSPSSVSPGPGGARQRRRWRFYQTAVGARPVQDFLDGLPTGDADEILASLADVRRNGLRVARHLGDPIYEVRVTTAHARYRVLFAAEGRRSQALLALDAFAKQTPRTPPAPLALAERRLQDWRARGAAPRRPPLTTQRGGRTIVVGWPDTRKRMPMAAHDAYNGHGQADDEPDDLDRYIAAERRRSRAARAGGGRGPPRRAPSAAVAPAVVTSITVSP